MTTPTTPPSLYDLLNKRFCAPQYALFYEVRNATGYGIGGPTNYADALAMSLWPSRGLDLTGIEIKRDRRDWLRELNNPAKAEAIAQYCEYWFIAVTNDEIVKLEELPKGWGLLVARGSKLVVAKDAPKRKTKPWPRAFIASLLRNSYETSWRFRANTTPNNEVEEKIAAEVERRVAKRDAEALANATREVQAELRTLRARDEICKRIEAAAGVSFQTSWRWDRIITAMERAGGVNPEAIAESMKYMITRLETALSEARAAERDLLAANAKPPTDET